MASSSLKSSFSWRSVVDDDSEFGKLDHSARVRSFLKENMTGSCDNCDASSIGGCICQDEGALKPKRGTVKDREGCTTVVGNSKMPSMMSVSAAHSMTAVTNLVNVGESKQKLNQQTFSDDSVDCSLESNKNHPRCMDFKRAGEPISALDAVFGVGEFNLEQSVASTNKFSQEISTCMKTEDGGPCLFSDDED
jgi:hypothetical protein